MKYRTVEILDETDPDARGTRVIPLNLQDPVTRIILYYIAYPLSQAMIASIAANITKIELTDGSDVLYSLDGYECQALAFYDRGINTLNGPNYTMGSAMTAMFPIDFGRFRYDPQLALDPSRFKNLMLKITYNEDLMDASIDEHTLEVYADVFDEKVISPVGFLSAKEWINYTPAGATAYKDVDLPTDEIIRRILVRGYKEKTNPTFVLGEVRLTEEEKKRVVFDWVMWKYYHEQMITSQPILERVAEYADAAGNYDKFVMSTDFHKAWVATPRASSDVWTVDPTRGGYLERFAEATGSADGLVLGRIPHHTFDFPMGIMPDIDDWYDVTTKGSVILRLRCGGTVGTHQVFLQQFRRY